jgi:ABC-type lipoprotein release transport system permease subunit
MDIVVDVPNTFVGVMLRGCEPKMQRKERDNPNSEQVPAQDKNGVPKYTVYLSVETKSSFGKKQFDEIEVTVTSPKNPCEGIPNGSEVNIERLIEGRMPFGKGKAVTTFFTADAIIPLKAAQFAQPGQSTRVASVQPQQPARAASGQ